MNIIFHFFCINILNSTHCSFNILPQLCAFIIYQSEISWEKKKELLQLYILRFIHEHDICGRVVTVWLNVAERDQKLRTNDKKANLRAASCIGLPVFSWMICSFQTSLGNITPMNVLLSATERNVNFHHSNGRFWKSKSLEVVQRAGWNSLCWLTFS